MKPAAMFHKHGGQITELSHVGHAIEGRGRNRRAFWFFRGNVAWHDGSTSTNIEIAPWAICHDETPGSRAEVMAALDAINGYLIRAGEWNADGDGWTPNNPAGLEPLPCGGALAKAGVK